MSLLLPSLAIFHSHTFMFYCSCFCSSSCPHLPLYNLPPALEVGETRWIKIHANLPNRMENWREIGIFPLGDIFSLSTHLLHSLHALTQTCHPFLSDVFKLPSSPHASYLQYVSSSDSYHTHLSFCILLCDSSITPSLFSSPSRSHPAVRFCIIGIISSHGDAADLTSLKWHCLNCPLEPDPNYFVPWSDYEWEATVHKRHAAHKKLNSLSKLCVFSC